MAMSSSPIKTSAPVILIWTILAAIYLIIRFGMTRWLDSFGIYTTYLIELMLVFISLVFASKDKKNLFKIHKFTLLIWPVFLAAGFFVFFLSKKLNIIIPLAIEANETVFFLLLVAPVLEELIFRFFLWQPLQKTCKNPIWALILTSIIFSYAHYHSVWFVPEEYFKFIYFQSAYTLLLGFACGYFMYKQGSIFSAIIVHFGFNFGFYLGAKLLMI
jgi:membrane protease YdiL (CAAX protease family)